MCGNHQQLQELINLVYISKMKQREAELIALEAQINRIFYIIRSTQSIGLP
jgi:sensor histidine kinase YesM